MFAFRLALALGVWDVPGMLAAMPLPLLREWMAYGELEPFGDERADLRAGIIASTVANAHRRPNRPPFKASDFMPRFRQAEQSGEDMISQAMAAMSAAQAIAGKR